MGKIPTNELLDNFFASPDGAKYASHRKIIKETQLYAYELKIGKDLVDMDADDLVGFFTDMDTRRNGADSNIISSNSTLDQAVVIYRRVFDYYINEYELIRNPFRDKKLKGTEFIKNISKGRERLTWKMVEDIIQRLHTDNANHIRADYLELIILLYYNGFENATEIVEMQESDINHRAKTVLLPGRTIHLSDRCYTLLTKFNAMTEGWRNYVLVSWHGSYFKFIVRASNEYDIDDRPLKAMRENINVYLCKYVNNEYNTHINYSNLYLLGFYDFLKNKFGEDKVNEMLLSNYDSDSVQQLQQSAREYGFKFENVSHLKRRLRMFVKTDEE